jgi:uncharacterized protein YxeA
MNKKKIIIGIVVLLIVVAAGYYFFIRQDYAKVYASQKWVNAKNNGSAQDGEVIDISGNTITHRSGVKGVFVDNSTINWEDGNVWKAV